jgi:hypothetical protein
LQGANAVTGTYGESFTRGFSKSVTRGDAKTDSDSVTGGLAESKCESFARGSAEPKCESIT